MKKLSLLLFAFIASFTLNAQTAEEIIDTYFENIGGKENFQKLEGLKFSVTALQGTMEIPAEMITLKNGKTLTSYSLQGIKLYQNIFDGETLWSTNQMTMKAEKSTKEDTDNHKLTLGDFPDPFLNYKENGYSIALEGNETIDGTETFKIKLTKKPMIIEGSEVADISYYFFDTENFVPIVVQNEMKSGPAKGMVMEQTLSDYQEIDGLYFPFSMKQGVKGKPGGMMITIDKIVFNPKVDDKEFAFPEAIVEETKKVTPSTTKPHDHKNEGEHKH